MTHVSDLPPLLELELRVLGVLPVERKANKPERQAPEPLPTIDETTGDYAF